MNRRVAVTGRAEAGSRYTRCSFHLIVVNIAPCGRAHAAVVDTEGTSVGRLEGKANGGAWGRPARLDW
jgi:hypothetical protein